jgi:hypothetical protein
LRSNCCPLGALCSCIASLAHYAAAASYRNFIKGLCGKSKRTALALLEASLSQEHTLSPSAITTKKIYSIKKTSRTDNLNYKKLNSKWGARILE